MSVEGSENMGIPREMTKNLQEESIGEISREISAENPGQIPVEITTEAKGRNQIGIPKRNRQGFL